MISQSIRKNKEKFDYENLKNIELKCEYNYVFDIARFGFIRLIVENTDLNKDITVLTCANCGDYVVRHSSRTIYCKKKNARILEIELNKIEVNKKSVII